ncbi:MAG TPA: response regulator [Candidatus Limnocylindria bacterium]|jgi:DNA-binding response OmpR family regulator|nr:response regulator [Candidatus Limnocylindria bacterium]
MAITNGHTRQRLVVVVEDDGPIGELLAGVINEERGYQAIHVSDPAVAMRTLEQVKPDLLVLDVNLPGMSGFEIYDRMRKDDRLKKVPVMFETAVKREQDREFRKRGITHVLQKPFDLNQLIREVKQLAPLAA